MSVDIYTSHPRWLDRPATVIAADCAAHLSALFRHQPIVYIMACFTWKRTWGAIYVGKALDGHRRLARHEKYNEARRYRFSHLHVIKVDRSDLNRIEELFIELYHPHLNKQHNTDYLCADRFPGPPISDEFPQPAWMDTLNNW